MTNSFSSQRSPGRRQSAMRGSELATSIKVSRIVLRSVGQRILLRSPGFLVVLCAVWNVVARASVFGMQLNGPDASLLNDVRSFGSPQILAATLIRVREMENHLRAVQVREDGSFAENSLISLEQIFAYRADVFETDPETSQSRSIRAEALQRLRQASPSAQRQWAQTVSVLAESRLRLAIQAGDRNQLSNVARQFPYTESAITATVVELSMDFLRGYETSISQRLLQLESETAGTIHEAFLKQAAGPLWAMLKATATTADPQSTEQPIAVTKETALSIATTDVGGDVSPPWPSVKWQWTESVWSYPGAPQPQAGTTLESFLPDTDNNLGDFSNWRPVFWGDSVVLRTPFRIVACDRVTGAEQWSLPTSTFTPTESSADSHGAQSEQLSPRFARPFDVGTMVSGLAAYGLLASDRAFLYFVDGFDFFGEESEDLELGKRIGVLNQFRIRSRESNTDSSSKKATRLTALRRDAATGRPVVAWTVGDSEQVDYRFVEPASGTDGLIQSQKALRASLNVGSFVDAESVTPLERIDDTDLARPSVTGHRFLGPPIGQDNQLFVLTIHNETTWLSCLTRGTGAVEWQQPLIFATDDGLNQFLEAANPAGTNSVCLLSGETVVCSLSSGVLVGVRATDGQLQWASAIRDEAEPDNRQGFPLPMNPDIETEEAVDSPCVILPSAAHNIVVGLDSQSSRVHGIDTTSGQILWSTSRRAFGPGNVGGSADYYLAGISGTQVVLIGERHCRSLDLKTGDQNWVVQIGTTTGRAECRGNRCLIPQADGHVMVISLNDGTAVRKRVGFLPEGAAQPFGSVVSDDDLVCMTTPVSLVVFPRADSLFPPVDVNDTAGDRSVEDIQQQVQARLLNGDDEAAIAILKAAILKAGGDLESKVTEPLESYLGELILQDWGTQRFASEESSAQNVTAPQQTIVSTEYTELLPQLNLKPQQLLRAAVLSVLSRQDSTLDEEDIEQLSGFKDWKQPVLVTDEWSVRPDVLLNNAGRNAGTKLAIAGDDFAKLSLVQLQRLAEDAVLFPQILKSDLQREQLLTRLVEMGSFAAAESVAIMWQKQAESQRPGEFLTQLRGRDVIAGFVNQPVTGANTKDRLVAPAGDGSVAPAGLTSSLRRSLTFESEVYLGVPDWDLQRVEKGLAINSLPGWMPLRHYLVDGREGFPDLVSVDMSDGSVRDRVTLPFPAHRSVVSYQALSNDQSTPGLLPLLGSEQIAMLSCTVADKARVLWTRRFRRADSGETPVEFGPLGADYFLWHHADELHCSHPLSGRDLWVRRLRLSPTQQMAGVRRIFGDESAMTVMGSDQSSVERFSTRDGRRLGAGRLKISPVSDAVTVGRCLLYPDDESRLHLYDSLTGRDMLENVEPVILGRSNPVSMSHVLTEGRVVTVSASFEIILIDTKQGRIVFRTPAASLIQTGAVFGLTAFERHGKLFVGIEEQREFVIRGVDRMLRPNEPRVYGGPLVCLNAETGKIEWTTPLEATGIPVLYGDPTDLMLMWSNPQADEPEAPQNLGHKINIQLVNSATGEIVAKGSSLSSSRPLRCNHIAAKEAIEVTTRDTTITIRPEAASDGTK